MSDWGCASPLHEAMHSSCLSAADNLSHACSLAVLLNRSAVHTTRVSTLRLLAAVRRWTWMHAQATRSTWQSASMHPCSLARE